MGSSIAWGNAGHRRCSLVRLSWSMPARRPALFHLRNCGGFRDRDGHARQNKPTVPIKTMESKHSQLTSPVRSKENPPTLPDHHHPEVSGCGLVSRTTINDKTEMESSAIPIWRRLMLIKVIPAWAASCAYSSGFVNFNAIAERITNKETLPRRRSSIISLNACGFQLCSQCIYVNAFDTEVSL